MGKILITLSLMLTLGLSGCGYTTSSLLPPSIKTICIKNFTNSISITAEQSELRMYRGYRPGMETEITKAVIDRFMFDGNLKIATEEKADLVLKSELIDYKRDSLRYDANDNVEEYRIKLIVSMQLEDTAHGVVLWTEKSFAGETTYMVGGSGAKSESTAIRDAITDLARRIVERTIEAW
jgi:hypothetical protein